MFFWKKWTARKSARRKPLVRTRVSDEQRQAYRAPVEFPVVYIVEGRPGMRTAVATDLSAASLRLIGDEDLGEETLVDLRFTLPNDLVHDVHVEKEIVETTARGRTQKKVMVPPEPFAEMTVRAKVVNAFLRVRRRKLSHGMQFVDVTDQTTEEIQRFIHVWQIRQLRERAHLRGE
ncbi:MAG: hypothetical protein M3169_13410 [Candidatus Eremiobacteraeota bacterium]|nr:hypothetical protein [Candidatus Eremiobacteraeota bacterium]